MTSLGQVDPSDSTGFSGLPEEWRQILKSSGIGKEETMRNPQIVRTDPSARILSDPEERSEGAGHSRVSFGRLQEAGASQVC